MRGFMADVIWELLEVAEAMRTGEYWKEPFDPQVELAGNSGVQGGDA